MDVLEGSKSGTRKDELFKCYKDKTRASVNCNSLKAAA